MSIKLRILIPSAIILVIGVLAAAAVGAMAIVSADSSARVTSASLAAIDQAAAVADAVESGEALISRVTGMTELIPADEIAAGFAAVEAAVAEGMAALRAHQLSAEATVGIDGLAAAATEWQAAARALLGLHPASEVPTLELLSRRSRVLGDALTALGGQVHADANALTEAANAGFRSNLTIGGGILAILLGVMALLSYRTVSRVGTDLRKMSQAMDALSGGDLSVEVTGGQRKDELGAMSRSLGIFRDALVERQRLEGEQSAESGQRAQRAQALADFQESLAVVLDQAAAGDFTKRIDTDAVVAEFRGFAARVNGLLDTVDRGVAETGEVLSALAETDLTQRVRGDYRGTFARLKTDTNKVADRFTDVVGQLKQTSGALKVAAGEILAGANDLSQRTSQQSSTIQETVETMARLAGTVTQNAERASEASAVAGKVSRTADEGGQVMTQATEAMERITQSSGKISNIIGLIDDIAFQTNLLALNASVEAARAGEAGKGFAVVAVEVRRLAQSAAEASRDVKQLIEQSAGEVRSGSKLVADAAARLASMLEAARMNNALMDAIAKDSREQAATIDEVNGSVQKLDEMTQHNAALVEETNAAIEQTEAQAVELDRIVDIFSVESDAPTMTRAAA